MQNMIKEKLNETMCKSLIMVYSDKGVEVLSAAEIDEALEQNNLYNTLVNQGYKEFRQALETESRRYVKEVLKSEIKEITPDIEKRYFYKFSDKKREIEDTFGMREYKFVFADSTLNFELNKRERVVIRNLFVSLLPYALYTYMICYNPDYVTELLSLICTIPLYWNLGGFLFVFIEKLIKAAKQ